MNTATRVIATYRLLQALLAVALLGALAQPAAAHKIDFRPPAYHYYYQHGSPYVFPRWLRKDRDFQRWYRRSDYRYIRGASWRRLYDMYLYDKSNRRLRHRHRHYQGRVVIDLDKRPRRRH